jgi:hypothetical protein
MILYRCYTVQGSSTPRITIFLVIDYFLQFLNYRNRYLILETIINRKQSWKFLSKLLTIVCTCMQKLRALPGVDICKQIFLYSTSYNFVQEFTA